VKQRIAKQINRILQISQPYFFIILICIYTLIKGSL
jgi:hypothetical protein